MKLLVTGAAGFIGSNFVQYWLSHHPEDQVVVFDALTYAGNPANLATVESNPNYRFIQGDIRDAQAVESAMEGIETIVHFAAETHVDRSILNPLDFVTTNVVGTQVLLDAARKHNVGRFHHISTDEVFGSLELNSSEQFSETTPYQPHSPYSASKAGSDHLVRAAYDTHGLPITITNCSNNYGPYHHPEKLIPLAITNLLQDKKVPVYGNGKNVRDWLFVEDHCSAIEAVLQRGTIGETYCVGGLKDGVSNLEVIKHLLKLTGKDDSSIEFVTDRPGHDQRYSVDWSKLHTQLGWSPSVTLEEGLQKTVEWYVAHPEWWQATRDAEFETYYQNQYKTTL